jgi:hypothetical protein
MRGHMLGSIGAISTEGEAGTESGGMGAFEPIQSNPKWLRRKKDNTCF